jgi:hypothetical protein
LLVPAERPPEINLHASKVSAAQRLLGGDVHLRLSFLPSKKAGNGQEHRPNRWFVGRITTASRLPQAQTLEAGARKNAQDTDNFLVTAGRLCPINT